jgi:hypothetical protein
VRNRFAVLADPDAAMPEPHSEGDAGGSIELF